MCLLFISYRVGPFVNTKSVHWVRLVCTRQLNNAKRCKLAETLSSEASSISIIRWVQFHVKLIQSSKKTNDQLLSMGLQGECKHRHDLFECDILAFDCRLCQIDWLMVSLFHLLVHYGKHFSAKWASDKEAMTVEINGKSKIIFSAFYLLVWIRFYFVVYLCSICISVWLKRHNLVRSHHSFLVKNSQFWWTTVGHT